MDITRAAIRNDRVTFLTLVVILLAGAGAYRTMSRAEDPGFTVRTALILTYFPGASPERVELLITDKLEKALQELPEVDFINSESKTGASVIFVNVRQSYTDMRPIWDAVRRKVERAAGELPDNVIGPIINDEFGDVFGIVLSLTGEGYDYRELKEVADQARDEFLRIEEAAKVEIHGAQDERLFIEYDNARLADLGLTPALLSSILESSNIVIPGGSVTAGSERIVLEPSGNFENDDDLRHTVVAVPGRSELIHLEDIATVTRSYIDPPRTLVYANGQSALALAISLREGGNIEALGAEVRLVADRLRTDYPIGLELEVLAFQPELVTRKVRDFASNLLQAIGIVVLVMLLTLGVRTGLVVAALIPMTMVMTLMLMSMFDIGLDQVSLAALIIALGMLVDNAIVMSESIMVQMASGKDRLASAVDSARELRIPLLVSSLTTSAAFLPIALAESSTGEYTTPIFQVVTIALLSSWLLALTMTPLLCVLFIRIKPGGKDSMDSPFYRRYRALLLALLRQRAVTVAGVVILFLGVLQLFRFVPNIFFPPSDRALVLGEVELPVGTAIERTDAVVASIQQFIGDSLLAGSGEEGVASWAAFIGAGAPKFNLSYNPEPASPEYALMFINTTSDLVREDVAARLDGWVFDNFPDVAASFRPLSLGPPVEAPIQVRVSGRETDALFEIVDSVKSLLASIPGTRSISDDWGARTKKLVVAVNAARARRAGVSNRDVAISLQSSLSGVETTQLREGDQVIPVVMRSEAADRLDLGKLDGLAVLSQLTGRSVPLRQVADVQLAWQPSRILRRGRLKTVTVSANLADGVTAATVNGSLVPMLDDISWEIGYGYELGGEAEASVEANQSIAAKLPLAMFIIVVLLVSQFNSFRKSTIVLITIPLGLIGVILGLLVTRSYFGFMTLLGIISLAGIVINNAIVLLDRIRIEIDENGLEPSRAVVEAAQRRLRPILLTTATTVGGLVPLWLGGGLMWEPMAIAIIFGLLFATALTLGVVPVLYSLFYRVDFRGFRY